MNSLICLLNKQNLGLVGWDQTNMELGEVIIIAFTGVVAASTVAYALLTWRLVLETRRLREVQTEPRVSMRLELAERVGHGGIELVIRNEGQGPAQNIQFNFQGDPTYFIGHGQRKPIDQIPVIENGIPYLGAGQSFRFLLGWLFGEAFDRANREPWTFRIDYENLSNTSKGEIYILDFSQFAGLIVGSGTPLVKIEKHLEALQKDFHHMTTGFNKLHVLTQTKEESRREMDEFLQRQRGKSDADEPEPKSSGETGTA